MKQFLIGVFILVSAFGMGQDISINDYKYIIVPRSYDIFSEADSYQMNSLTKFLFEKYGFSAILENSDYPEDLASNNCLALKANVIENNTLIKTKLQVTLKDCRNTVVYTSSEGESKAKEYKTAYQTSLREAFKSIEALNYRYVSSKAPSTEIKNGSVLVPEIKPTAKINTEVVAEVIPDPVINETLEVESESTLVETEDWSVNKQPLKKFKVVLRDNGFSLLASSGNTILGNAIKTSKEGVYIYNSINANGLAYFNSTNDLVVEYVSEDGTLVKKVFQL